MEFTPAQCRAISRENLGADTCVVAGPGSGKTTVLVEYFRQLVASGIDPLRILAITFTEKAAANMRQKLADAFQGEPAMRARLERAYVSTVHGFCARLLRENAISAGVDPEFSVLNERESLRLQTHALSETTDQLFSEDWGRMRQLLHGLASTELRAIVPGVYEAARAAGVDVAELAAFPGMGPDLDSDLISAIQALRRQRPNAWSDDQRAHLVELLEASERIVTAWNGADPTEKLRAIAGFRCNLRRVRRNTETYSLLNRISKELIPEIEYVLMAQVYTSERESLYEILLRFDRRYRERKRQVGGLDYADLEEFAVRLLKENPDVRRQVQEQFDQVLMDELQDTNGQQANLLDLIRRPDRFYAVGDINQSIYGFRHAEPDVFRTYRDSVARRGSNLVELVENFRSRPDILSAVEAVLRASAGIEPRLLVPKRQFSEKSVPSVEVLVALGANAPVLEAQWVARRIVDLCGDGFDFKDIAVLVRNSEVFGDFTQAFDLFGIPCLVSRGKGFYETREVIDLTHMLRILVNPRDEISLAAVLRSPFVAVSDEALLRLKVLGNLGDALQRLDNQNRYGFDPEDWKKLLGFRDQLFQWRAQRDYVGFDRVLLSALDETGYFVHLDGRGTANTEKFLAQAREASARQPLHAFVEELELLRDSDPREPDAPPEDSANAVKMMTVHSAKGLEFPIVFVAALHKGVSQKIGPLSFSPRFGLGARWRNPVTGEDKDDWFQHSIRQERKAQERDEGNRLLYVAMTRAEEHLVLSFAHDGSKLQNWAAIVRESLGLDLDTPRVETRSMPWPLAITCTDQPPDRTQRCHTADPIRTVQIMAPPEIPDQYDSNTNVTSIAIFAACPRKYYLSRYLNWEARSAARAFPDEEEAGDVEASEFGRQVHTLLAGGTVESASAEALRLARNFQSSSLGARAARASRVEREFEFLMAVEDVVLRGQIDLWFEENGRLILVDYKTDKVKASETQNHALAYSPQIRLYASALEHTTGRAPDEAYIYLLRADIAVPIDLTPTLFDSPQDLVRSFRQAQTGMDFPLNEGTHCRKCPYFRGLCPSGMTDVVRAPAIDGEDLRGDEARLG